MANLNSAIKRIENKGKKSVDPKKNKMAEATKPPSKNLRFKRPNIRSYKNPETGKVDMDRYRSDQAKYKKIKQDQAKAKPAEDRIDKMKPDGVDDKRTKRGERKLKAIDKVTKKRDALVKKRAQTASDVTNKAAEYAKKSISATSGAFGTTSFAKESITFKDYLNKL